MNNKDAFPYKSPSHSFIKPGDVVKYTANNIVVTVNKIGMSEAYCYWFEGRHCKEGAFPLIDLEFVRS